VVTQHLDVAGQPLQRVGAVERVGADQRDGVAHDVRPDVDRPGSGQPQTGGGQLDLPFEIGEPTDER
jgi:hypothetical protein